MGERGPDGFEHASNGVATQHGLHAVENDAEDATDDLFTQRVSHQGIYEVTPPVKETTSTHHGPVCTDHTVRPGAKGQSA